MPKEMVEVVFATTESTLDITHKIVATIKPTFQPFIISSTLSFHVKIIVNMPAKTIIKANIIT